MKLSHSPRGGRLMTGLFAGLLAIQSTVAAPLIPTGSLTIDRTQLRVGDHARLGWQITYPVKSNPITHTARTGTPVAMQFHPGILLSSDSSRFRNPITFITLVRDFGSVARSHRNFPASPAAKHELRSIATPATLE